MPDGDILHDKLAGKYQGVYKKLCEGHFSLEEIAQDAAEAVQKDIKRGGDRILQMIQTAAAQIDDILLRKWGETINWRQEIARLDALERSTYYAPSDLKKLAYDACREVLEIVRQGGQPSDCYGALLSAYQNQVYTANLEERVPLKQTHYNGVSQEFVGEQLEQLRPLVQSSLQPYARSIQKNGTVHLSRKPASPRGTKKQTSHFDINTDVPVIH